MNFQWQRLKMPFLKLISRSRTEASLIIRFNLRHLREFFFLPLIAQILADNKIRNLNRMLDEADMDWLLKQYFCTHPFLITFSILQNP
jgi:hypothetical protein